MKYVCVIEDLFLSVYNIECNFPLFELRYTHLTRDHNCVSC